MTNKTRSIRISYEMIEMLDIIIDQEKERGRDKTSYGEASIILTKRINKAGGLVKQM